MTTLKDLSRSATKQFRVTEWVRAVFTGKEANDAQERSLRTAEEALELAQACGVDVVTLHRLVDYVMGRPAGKPAQEIAGTMVTLYAMAAALDVDADAEFEIELERIGQPEVIDRCRRRQHEKREALTPSEADQVRAFLALSPDRYRPPYGKITTLITSDEVDSVRYALRDAVEKQIDRCGGIVEVRSIPDETVAEAFLESLRLRGLAVVAAGRPPPITEIDEDEQVGNAGSLG